MLAMAENSFGVEDWESVVMTFQPTGSRYICNPAPTDTDEDFICWVTPAAYDALVGFGFKQCGSPEFYTGNDNGGFRSWRRGAVNLITTESVEFYTRFTGATEIAKRLNILEKADRIALFQVTLYGVDPINLQRAK